MQNLAMKRSALESLIKELAMMPEEDKEGGLHNAQGLSDSHEDGTPTGRELGDPDPAKSAVEQDEPSGSLLPDQASEVEDQTVPAVTEALEAVKGVDLDHDNEIDDVTENNESVVKKVPSISEKVNYDDISLDELKKVKAALQAKGLI